MIQYIYVNGVQLLKKHSKSQLIFDITKQESIVFLLFDLLQFYL